MKTRACSIAFSIPPALLVLAPLLLAAAPARADDAPPANVLVITIDTLRADHVSAYGYARPTTPNIDRLIEAGVRFDAARTVEPLTGPALVSMLTSQHPHDHGASRNGLRMRTGLASLPKTLQARGYRTAAFVGNWTLRDKLCGLAEHFEQYEEVLTRRRWWGLVRKEADAGDLTQGAIDWLDARQSRPEAPFLLWIHYVEPHAPYRAHDRFRGPLGLRPHGELTAAERYDTEIAFVDEAVGRLMAHVEQLGLSDRTIVVFASDHGESLGEHGYWGHGRNLYEQTLRIPMSITWPERLAPRTIAAPALLIDLTPTVIGLLDAERPAALAGFDWTAVFAGAPEPLDRETRYQAHRGAVMSQHESDLARRSGLLAVGILRRDVKEVFYDGRGKREMFDLAADPAESRDLSGAGDRSASEAVLKWMTEVENGLSRVDAMPPAEPLDEDTASMLRSLGYVD